MCLRIIVSGAQRNNEGSLTRGYLNVMGQLKYPHISTGNTLKGILRQICICVVTIGTLTTLSLMRKHMNIGRAWGDNL